MKHASFLFALAGTAATAQQPGIAVNATSPQPPIAGADSPPPRIISVTPVTPPPIRAVRPPAPPPSAFADIVKGPQARRPAQAYVSADDYPPSALAQRAAGRVRVVLTIGRDGRVVGCAIVRSSGYSVLDSVTCNLLRRRARFTPAMDSNGNPAVGTIVQQVEWRLP